VTRPVLNIRPSAWFVALCLAWLLPGVVGHVPWKGPDAETFADFLAVREQGTWLFPGAAKDFSPLYLWIAQLFGQAFSAFLPLHDAVRLASGALAGLALWLTALTARRLYDFDAGWPAVFALMGCMGLLVPVHEINPYTAQLAAASLFAYGLVRMLEQPLIGGGLAGLGLSALFLAGAWLPALALALALALLPLLFPSWRTSARVGSSWFALSVVLAVCGAWLLSVHAHAPEKLVAWWQEALSGVVFSAGEKTKYHPLYFLNALAWFAWPAWLVAGWAVYRLKREGWDSVRLWMPLGVFLVSLFALSLHTGTEQVQSIILLPPLALLAGAGLAELRRGAANALMWFSIMAFSFFALVFWVYWAAFDLGWPAQLAKRLVKLGMESEGLRVFAALLGTVVTAAWVIGLGWIRRQPRVPQRPILIWSAGLTFIWCLLMALFMGPLDKRLGYAAIAGELQQQAAQNDCVATRNVSATHRTLLAYHSGLDIRSGMQQDCEWLLAYGKSRKENPPEGNWIRRWEGARPGEKGERFWLYRRAQ
jgi:4-amino-4-deoxy-L-arabinose transferase-like glycosyltransferase